MTDLRTLAVIVALAGVTVLTRSFFLFSNRPSSLPRWAERGLHYAPVAALAAVVAPEIVLTEGELIRSIDARVLAALAGGLAFLWTRSVFGTILAGMAVYLPLHIGLGW
jgi:branched-subunit amino acid transport protein